MPITTSMMNAVRGANAKYLQELEEEKKKKRKAQEEAEAAAEAKKRKDEMGENIYYSFKLYRMKCLSTRLHLQLPLQNHHLVFYQSSGQHCHA